MDGRFRVASRLTPAGAEGEEEDEQEREERVQLNVLIQSLDSGRGNMKVLLVMEENRDRGAQFATQRPSVVSDTRPLREKQP